MNSPTTRMAVDEEQANQLVRYSLTMGTTPEECLREALNDWLLVVAPSRLEARDVEETEKHILLFPVQAPAETAAVV